MKERVKKLIDVKSFITLSLTVVFCIMSLKGEIQDQFLTIYTTIIAFYFGTQYQKNSIVENRKIE
jgi:hypothetical protein